MNSPLPSFQGLLVDDDSAAERTARRFSSTELQIEFRRPASLEEFARSVFDSTPAILILDYRLDERPDNEGNTAQYKASALAQQLRDLSTEFPGKDFPIVLHSAEAKLREVYRPEKTAHDLFDGVIEKETNRDTNEIRKTLMGLIDGYQLIIGLNPPYSDHARALFGLVDGQESYVDYQDVHHPLDTLQVPHVLARFILKQLIHRNSLLLDLPSVLARAGIDKDDVVAVERLVGALAEVSANYRGVFAAIGARWWRQGVERQLEVWFGVPSARLTAEQRASKFGDVLGGTFAPARSTWSGRSQERFSHSCAVCQLPTHASHSVALLERGSGVLSERRRLCFDCLQQDKHLRGEPLSIDALDLDLAKAVREGTIARDE